MPDILIRGTSVSNLIGKVIEIGYDAADCLYAFVDGGATDILETIELPEHGNLIDQNELYELVKQRGKNWVGEWCDFECHINGNDIKNAPIIVPSNKGD